MERSKAAAAIQKRFGNSTIAKQAALAATKALASSTVSGQSQTSEQYEDKLYKKASSQSGRKHRQQQAESSKSGATEHRPAPGALQAVTKPSMEPFFTQREELQLDDNKSYCMPKEHSLDEQLFRGHLNPSVTPPGHSEAPCTEAVHGGDSRFGARSPGFVLSAQMGGSAPAQRPDPSNCAQKQRSPSLAQRKEEVQRLKKEGATHALPPYRPHSPLPEDRLAMQNLVDSMSRVSTTDDHQVQDSAIGGTPGEGCESSASAAPYSSSPAPDTKEQSMSITQDLDSTSNGCATEDRAPAGDQQHHSDCATLASPQRALSPAMPDVPRVAGKSSPDSRPLSPMGKVIKSVTSELRHSAPPDMSKVKARYLDVPGPEGSREESPSRRAAHERHYWWRLGQMHADVPDYKSSQARMYENDHCLGTGSPQAVVTLKQVAWSFDGTHPALAGEHCMRTREQNEALEKERLTAQRRLDEARRVADDQQRRAPARRAQLAAAARASADSARSQDAASSPGHLPPNHQQRPRSAGPMSRSTAPCTTAAGFSSQGQDEALRRLQLQSNAIAQRAQAVITRSEQLGETFDAPMNAETEVSASLRPQTAPNVGSQAILYFTSGSTGQQRPMMPLVSASGAANDADSVGTHAADTSHQCADDEPSAHSSKPHSIVHDAEHGVEHHDDDYRDEEVATGAYSDARYAAYAQDLNLDMQLRFTAGVQVEDVEGGYESDLERDTVQLRNTAAADAATMLVQSFEHEATEQGTSGFRDDNSWMDAYRKDVVSRCRSEGMPEAGYFEEVEAGIHSPEPITADLPDTMDPAEADLLQQRLIPADVGLVANEAIARAERVTAARARARAREGYHSDDAFENKKNFVPTRSKTFGFEKRAQSRPKPIAQVKMEQDLEMKRRKSEKEAAQKFKANKVPRTSSKKSDGLFYKKQLEQSIAAKERIEYRKQELSEMLSSGSAFSFYEKDLQRREEKARRLEAHRNNKNRFQVKFKAKEVPAHVRESRLVEMLEKQQQRKEIARDEAHKKLSSVNEEFAQTQGRVANAMAAAMQPFVGTVEDNIMCMLLPYGEDVVSKNPESGRLHAIMARQQLCIANAKAPKSRSVHPLVLAAAKAVGLHDTIMQLPKKYKTLLQEQGHTLGYHELNNAERHLLGLARKNFEVRAKHSALRHTDTLWNKYSGKKPVGAVPDFDVLHAQWETRLSTAREQLRQRTLTKPEDFSFNSGTPKQIAEREAREAERHQKVVLDKMLDEEELTELRWPFKSCRGKVHPTEPPVFLPVKYHETQASQLRRKYMEKCKERGQYELRSVKEERARSAAKQELQRRAKAHVAKEQAEARRRILQDLQTGNNGTNQGLREGGEKSIDGDTEPGEGDETTANAEADATLDRLSEAHRQSRHSKIETDVTSMTRELLATAGLDVLRFVEGPQHPTQSAKQVLASIVDSIPRNRAEVAKQLSHHDDAMLKQCLREVGLEWDTTGNARQSAIDRLKKHIWNFMR